MNARTGVLRLLLPAALWLALAALSPAAAEVRVSGSASDVTVEAHAVNLTAIVAALSKATGIRIAVDGTDNVPIDGTYRGSVKEVLSDILRNVSFLITDVSDANGPGLLVTLFVGNVPPPPPSTDNL